MKSFFLCIIYCLLSILLIGCSAVRQIEDNSNILSDQSEHFSDDESETENSSDASQTEDAIKAQIEKMTLKEKIGQMVMVGLEGYTVDDKAQVFIDDYKVGGFILFGKNIKNTEQLLDLTNELKLKNKNNSIPLFLSIDEEGGRISRLPSELKKMPSNRIVGSKDDPNLSYKIGITIAKQISSLGFNMNFAPVMDIDSNPANPVIGDRSFGPDEKIVSELGTQTMKGMMSKDIVPVVKHFPGHGDTLEDSHLGLPTVKKSLQQLLEFEIVPFEKAVNSGADAVMVAHILYEKIDAEYPSTLSKNIIDGILRKRLRFDGLVITDDMTMGAITKNFDIARAAILSINAGSDIVLVCHGYDNGAKVLNAVKQAVEKGEISEERINQSMYRILKIKNKYKLSDEKIESINISDINKEADKILDYFS